MNTYTKRSMFTESAQHILANCILLEDYNCVILNDVLYERLDNYIDHKYRFFFNTDDYDYLENNAVIAQLDAIFK
jgi:hypothetical protein